MERTEALRRTLESLSRVYHEDDGVPVKFGKPSRAVPEGHDGPDGTVWEDTVVVSPNVREELGRNLSGAQELRCLANTLSHEIEHIHESDLTGKEDFMDEYEDHSQFAGAVINILEDQYIDHQRTQRYPGLRKAQAFVIDALMDNHHRWPRVDNIDSKPKAMMEGLRQVAFAGYAKGFSEAPEWLREYLGRVRPLIDECRCEDDQEERNAIAHRVMDISLEYLPEREDVDLPDECAVCGDRPPVIMVPLLGPVCEECAPGGHGKADGDGDGARPEDLEAADGDGGVPPEDLDLPEDLDPEDLDAGGAGPGEGDQEGAGEGEDGDGAGDGGAGGDTSGSAGFQRGDDDEAGEQSPVSDSDTGRDIDPTEWDWLDLDGHEDHTVSIVDDDAEV